MYYNNVMSIPFMIPIIYYSEWKYLLQYDKWNSIPFWFCFLASTVQAFLLNYFIFLCSIVNSPLTTSITGQLKNIIQVILGLMIFRDVIITWLLGFGLVMSTLASIWYAIIKYDQQQADKKVKVDDDSKKKSLTEIVTNTLSTKVVIHPTKDV